MILRALSKPPHMTAGSPPVDDAIAEATHLLPREISQGQPNAARMGSIGAMREAADELDEFVADSMTRRREEPWQVNPAPGNGWRCQPVLSGKKEFIVTRNDIAGFVH